MRNVSDAVADATTTLLCGPTSGSDAENCCTDLLTTDAIGGREVLWVTFTRTPRTCAESVPDDVPVRGIVAVGDACHRETAMEDVTVEVVVAAADVAALGIKLSRLLSATDADLVVCFDSVTALCQDVDPETAYGFLHSIVTQIYLTDARAHFHLNPTAHDEATVDLFASLCDAVVELGDGDPTVRVRPVDE